MKMFNNPSVEVIKFSVADVITASNMGETTTQAPIETTSCTEEF